MSRLIWDALGEKIYETGIDHGVLYVEDVNGAYPLGVVWNGLTGFTESPGGAELTDLWADNIKYASIRAAETFGGTLEAYTYPTEFEVCDGSAALAPGVLIGQQNRKTFGLSYRTLIGGDNAAEGNESYKIHLVYGAAANPSEKAYATMNDSPEGITFSWELTTMAIPVTGFKPTATLVIDSSKVDPTQLAELEDILYGTVGNAPRLPLPNEITTLVTGTSAAPVTAPTFVAATGVLTIPTKLGVAYYVDGVLTTAGPMAALDGGVSVDVEARPATGYYFPAGTTHDWFFTSTKP